MRSGPTVPSLIELDREIARRSFYRFACEAWAHIGDPYPLIENWHLRAVADECQEMTRGTILRSVVNVPPGSAKTTMTGVLWPAWVWGPMRDPEARWMFASYDASLLLLSARRLETLLDSRWYEERWGSLLTGGARALHDLRTRAGGGRFSTSLGGKALGRHAKYQVIDDPIKTVDAAIVTGAALDKAWDTIANTFATRAIDPPNFRRMIVGQRVGEGDPSEHALAEGWHSLRLPTRCEVDDKDERDPRTQEGEPLFPARWPLEWCEEFERVAPDVWATQYQQRPSQKGGSIWREEWIETYAISVAEWEALHHRAHAVQSWDFTFKGKESLDWVAGQWWKARDGEYFLGPNAIHEPLSFNDSAQKMRDQRDVWPCSRILIEDKANGPAIENHLAEEFPGLLELRTPLGSKTARAQAVAPLFANGKVHVVRDAGYDARKRLFSRFPRVRRDDPVDAASQALLYLAQESSYFEALLKLGSP